MSRNFMSKIENTINKWLLKEDPAPDIPLSNFDALASEMKLADVILVEGRAKVSQVIKLITQSQWSHSALYVGSLSELKDESLRKFLTEHGVKDEHTVGAYRNLPWDKRENIVCNSADECFEMIMIEP